MINSYSSIYAIGHRLIADIFKSDVLIEEKVDGSQFSMQKINGQLFCRSKGQELIIDNPEKLFSKAVEVANLLDLHDGWVYRCEYLAKPKHNTLAYNRTPINNLIVFDISTGIETYLSYDEKLAEAHRLGLECVPILFSGQMKNFDSFMELLDRESVLGGCKIEGFVVKNYNLFTADKKVALGKYVSEAFKEKHITNWKERNPGGRDILQNLIFQLKTEARWNKAVQHLKEAGKLEESPRDIGNIMKEVQADVLKEEKDFVIQQLFDHFWPQIQRGVTGGIPEWYKATLAKQAFIEAN